MTGHRNCIVQVKNADKIEFYEGDRIGACQLLRRKDGDRHVIIAFILIRRGVGRLDAIVTGTGEVKSRTDISEEFWRQFTADMKKTSIEAEGLLPSYTIEWVEVDVAAETIKDQIALLQRAGVQIWTGGEGGE